MATQPFKVTEKRRLFLPPDPPRKGPRCKNYGWGNRCLLVEGHDGWCFVNMDPKAKHVIIRSDRGLR